MKTKTILTPQIIEQVEHVVKNGTFGKEKSESAKKLLESGIIEKAEKLLRESKRNINK